ncbi:MAG TPA: hypothetical protein VMY37_35770 [Thermoguttaceae bacterium]|nr:hypothetical protein [Thermoguttaceae bacterium]
MTTTLRSSIDAKLAWTWDDRAGTSLITDSNRLAFDKSLADGVDADQADAVWHAEDQTLLAGQSTTLDLDALEQSCFGDTIFIPLAKVKAILIVNKNPGGSGYLRVGGAPVDEWHAPFGASGHTVKVMPDAPLLVCNPRDGWDVAIGGTALGLAAVGDDVTYDVAILGTLAGGSGSSSS